MCILPKEIWTEIYSYLTPRNIRTCSLVCKAWNTAAASFHKDTICVILKHGEFEQFLGDLIIYPSLAPKVTKLTVTTDDTMDDPLVLQSILNQCENLRVVKFTETQIQKYFEMLNSKETQLPNIQRLEVKCLTECSPETRQLQIATNYKFSSTITTLVFGSVDSEKLQ